MTDLSIYEDGLAVRDAAASAVTVTSRVNAAMPLLRRPACTWHAFLPWLVPLLLYALWWRASHAGWMAAQILPSPEQVAQSAREMLSDDLTANLIVSLQRLAIGFACGAVVGTVLGILTGGSALGEAVIGPSLYAFAQVPPLALIPLLMVVVGIGEGLKILLIAKAVVIPMAIQTDLGVRSVAARLDEVAGIVRLSRWQRLRLLVVPSALPAWLTGVRQALAQGWLTLVAVELLASSEGIGYLMVDGRQMFELDVVFVCIAVIGLTGFVLDRSVQRFEAVVVRWPPEAHGPRHGVRIPGWRRVAYGAALPLFVGAVWLSASRHAWIDPRLLPAPAQVLACAWADVRSGALLVPLEHTLARGAQGLAVGALAGIAGGLLLGSVRWVRRAFGSTLTGLRQVAIFAWIPLLTAWAGIDEPAKIVFVALAAFFPVVFATQRAVEALPEKLIEVSRTLRLGGGQRLRWLVIPAILPGVVAGLRLALVYAWLGAIGAEYFMPSGVGLGSFMMDAQQLFRMDRLLSAAVVVGSLGALLGWLGTRLEKAAAPWRETR